MGVNPHQVTRDLETALCAYTGAPYAVAVTSCTMALLLAVAWHMRTRHAPGSGNQIAVSRTYPGDSDSWNEMMRGNRHIRSEVEIPRRTYVSVPMSIIQAGARPTFRDEAWRGAYRLKPLRVWDSARWLTTGLYERLTWEVLDPPVHKAGGFVCVSFHAAKILADTQGGAILHDSPEADVWLRRARFDGRTEGVHPKNDTFDMLGWHCYMSPDVAARLLWKLSVLPKHNEPLPNDDYPDLSQQEAFR